MLPSAYESFGLAALEAMGCQVPVISSNAGGIPEINIHGVTGYLTDVGDVESMAKYSIELLSDETKLNTFKENALAQAQRFNINNIVPQAYSNWRCRRQRYRSWNTGFIQRNNLNFFEQGILKRISSRNKIMALIVISK
jgi:glycosyltransferase involved in cell wall biosynthesis